MDNRERVFTELIKKKELAKYADLIPGFIHNLNTPLMSISGRIELIQFKHPDIKGIDQLLEQLDRVTAITNNLKFILEMDKNWDHSPVQLNKFFESLNHLLKLNMSFKHKIKFSFDVEEGTIINTVPFYFLNALYEIMHHSIEDMPNGGKIDMLVLTKLNTMHIIIKRDGHSIPDFTIEKLTKEDVVLECNQPDTGLLIAKLLLKEISGKLRIDQNNGAVSYILDFTTDM